MHLQRYFWEKIFRDNCALWKKLPIKSIKMIFEWLHKPSTNILFMIQIDVKIHGSLYWICLLWMFEIFKRNLYVRNGDDFGNNKIHGCLHASYISKLRLSDEDAGDWSESIWLNVAVTYEGDNQLLTDAIFIHVW